MSMSQITVMKSVQGYVPAGQRRRCASCQHAHKTGADSMQCRLGRFLVTPYALCNRWAMQQPPGFKPATD